MTIISYEIGLTGRQLTVPNPLHARPDPLWLVYSSLDIPVTKPINYLDKNVCILLK